MEIKAKRKYPLTEEEWRLKRLASAKKAEERNKKISAEEWARRKLERAEARRYKRVPPEVKAARKEARNTLRLKNLSAENIAERIAKRRLTRKLWRLKNIDKMRAVSRAQYQKYRARILSNKRLYAKKSLDKRRVYKQNRDSLKRLGGKLSVDIVRRLNVLQKGMCPYCRCDLSMVKTNLDHIIPLKLGGSNTDENVQLLCRDCNASKSAKHPIDFAQQLGLLL